MGGGGGIALDTVALGQSAHPPTTDTRARVRAAKRNNDLIVARRPETEGERGRQCQESLWRGGSDGHP